MRIINVVEIKSGIIDNITSFGVFDESKVQEISEKAEALFIKKTEELGNINPSENDIEYLLDEGYFEIMNASVCLSWSDVEE